MQLELRALQKADGKKAIRFAIVGMNFNCYMDSALLLKLYGRYFWYLERSRASQVIAAYAGDELAGVLLADMRGEPKCGASAWQKLYVRVIDWVQRVFFRDGTGPYDRVNAGLYREFSERYSPDGELCFLAANPELKIKGVGTLLLKELERREPGKRIYLYTDNNCSWQFYEHRGFARICEKQIQLTFADKGEVPLSCYLYSKVCGRGNG